MPKYYSHIRVMYGQTVDLTAFEEKQTFLRIELPSNKTFSSVNCSIYKNVDNQLIPIGNNPYISWILDKVENTLTCSILSSICPQILKEGDLITIYLELI